VWCRSLSWLLLGSSLQRKHQITRRQDVSCLYRFVNWGWGKQRLDLLESPLYNLLNLFLRFALLAGSCQIVNAHISLIDKKAPYE
jgi:hypothetical protein